MAVSDLTNTTWVFKQGEFTDEISITDATYNINFICNSVNYSQIILADTYDYGTISYDTTEVYMYHYEDASQTGWYETYYRTIEITGGTDVTNANLISWLEANATQQDPSAPPPQLANRYGLNYELYAESDTDLETPLISIDFVNVSNIELTSGRTWATGDQDHGNMIGFNDPIQGSVTISTQVMTDALLHVVSGGMAGQGTNTIVFQRVAGQAPKAYIMTASTVWQDADGNVHSEDLLFHKAVPRVAYNVSYSGDGDPLSMDVVFDLMENSTGNVVTIEKAEINND